MNLHINTLLRVALKLIKTNGMDSSPNGMDSMHSIRG